VTKVTFYANETTGGLVSPRKTSIGNLARAEACLARFGKSRPPVCRLVLQGISEIDMDYETLVELKTANGQRINTARSSLQEIGSSLGKLAQMRCCWRSVTSPRQFMNGSEVPSVTIASVFPSSTRLGRSRLAKRL
jgi:hypothetical protein